MVVRHSPVEQFTAKIPPFQPTHELGQTWKRPLPTGRVSPTVSAVSRSLRQKLSAALAFVARLIGSRIRDAHTREVLGTAFLVSWRGKLHLIGYTGPPIYPVFLPQGKVNYWRQSMGFTAHPDPDFEHVGDR